MASPQIDWFSKNAPQQGQTQHGGDWFAQNAPKFDNSQPTQFERDRMSDVGLAPVQRAVAKAAGKPAPNLGNLEPTAEGRLVPVGSTYKALPFAAANNVLYPGTGTAAQGLKDVAQGNVARGVHGLVSGGLEAASTALPMALEAAPITLARGLAGGVVGSQVGSRGAQALGAGPDVQNLAGDVGGLAGGIAGATELNPASGLKEAATGAYQKYTTSAVRSTIPEAANLPVKAVSGVEDIYRASAPVGTNVKARANLYTAAGDLAQIGRNAEAKLSSAKGGILQPDMRVRAAVDAANEHLQNMYQTERAPQIDRHSTNLIDAKLSTDAKGGLEYLASNAGDSSTRALATKAMGSPDMSLSDADQLARTVNTELRKFESLAPADRQAAMQTNSKINGLKDLDQELGSKINTELVRNGEEGIKLYERRYAAVSSVRDGLQRRMNAVELQRKIPGSGMIRAIRGGKEGIASASQAAVADVNIGKSIENGLRKLADTDLQPQRYAARSPVRGLLPAHSIELVSQLTPLGGTSPVPMAANTTRAQRLNLLLPARAGGPYVTPVPGALDFTPTNTPTPLFRKR